MKSEPITKGGSVRKLIYLSLSQYSVFDSGPRGFLKDVDEAWLLKNSAPSKIVNYSTSTRSNGDAVETFLVDMGRRIGYEGGARGADNANPALNYIQIVVKNGNEIVTAFPKGL